MTNIPGSQSVSSFTLSLCRNRGDPMVGAQAHLLPSLNSEKGGGDHRKSEMPIVAMKSGNSDGAKGRRFEITGNGYMTRH